MIRAFVGDNWMVLKAELDGIIGEFISKHGEYSYERIEGEQADINKISNSLQTVSMFEPNKLVVISGLSQNKQVVDKIEDLVGGVDEATELIFIESTLDKRSSYYKFLKKLDGYKEFKNLSFEELPKWVVDYAKNNQGKIELRDANYLIERVGSDQTLLSQELAKLIQYNANISRENIEELTVENPRSTIFNLIDAAFSGDKQKALKLYEEQRMQRVEPQAIAGMMIWQMHIVAVCLAGGNRTTEQISRESGINSFVAGKAQNIARRMGLSQVKEFLETIRNIEITSRKQTYNYDDALKYAILTLGK